MAISRVFKIIDRRNSHVFKNINYFKLYVSFRKWHSAHLQHDHIENTKQEIAENVHCDVLLRFLISTIPSARSASPPLQERGVSAQCSRQAA